MHVLDGLVLLLEGLGQVLARREDLTRSVVRMSGDDPLQERIADTGKPYCGHRVTSYSSYEIMNPISPNATRIEYRGVRNQVIVAEYPLACST
jgi:hypothetical protein